MILWPSPVDTQQATSDVLLQGHDINSTAASQHTVTGLHFDWTPVLVVDDAKHVLTFVCLGLERV